MIKMNIPKLNNHNISIRKALVLIQIFFSSLSSQARLITSLVFGISVFITLSAFLIISNIQSNIDRQVLQLNYNLKAAQVLSQISGQALIMNYKTAWHRKERLNALIKNFLKEHPEICYIIFTDNAGNILAKSQLAHLYWAPTNNLQKILPPRHVPFIEMSYTKGGKTLTIAEPIQFQSNFLGWAWLGIPDSGFTIVGSKKELMVFLLEIFLLVWVLSIIGAIINSLIITQPLRKLEKSAKAISEGRFGFQLPLKGFLGKELSQLVKAFNRMSKRLKQYEESNLAILGSERNKFESVIMSIADAVIVLDKENIIQIINPRAKSLLNKSGDELIGRNIISIWGKEINKDLFDHISNLTNPNDGGVIEYTNFELVNENKNLKIVISPLYDSNNEKLGTVMIIQDRTKEAEIELIKQEFISNVSHELRTPITSIKCYIDTLCSHDDQIDIKTKNEFLQIINEEADRLSNLVNDVLELSKLESTSAKLQLTLQEIYPSIEFSLKSIAVLASKKSIWLVKDIEDNLPSVYINQENLERILINLLSNAIKYTPGNGMVKLVVQKDKDNVLFQVIDNGIGILEEHIPLIFERFYRIENKVHTIKGTGLGLTIVKKSIEQHGSKLSVRSKLGEGSIFEFALPIPTQESSTEITNLENKPSLAKSA
ncbi:MAG: HAMP domain-containing protein [Candidatus Melainabacteria bacterium]|nr:HAMP domain-containing protein [Candidatus Melainabacteria bacterium]